jgi:hypothetical protein
MRSYRRTVPHASPLSKRDPQYHAVAKVRENRAALRHAALQFTETALCVGNQLHERMLLAARAEEATKSLGRICRTLEAHLAR